MQLCDGLATGFLFSSWGKFELRQFAQDGFDDFGGIVFFGEAPGGEEGIAWRKLECGFLFG